MPIERVCGGCGLVISRAYLVGELPELPETCPKCGARIKFEVPNRSGRSYRKMILDPKSFKVDVKEV